MIKIIPAIDLINGQCVRLCQGDYGAKTVYNKNPCEVARTFAENNVKYLHLVDLDGAKTGEIKNANILQDISKATNLHIDYSGGLRTARDVDQAFNCGARKVTIGSMSVLYPKKFTQIVQQYGGDKIILGADVKDNLIATHGWRQTHHLDIFTFIERNLGKGIKDIMVTDVASDGLLAGPAFTLYREIVKRFKQINLIASGGVTTVEDIDELDSMGIYAVIIGKAIYENRIHLPQLRKYLC